MQAMEFSKSSGAALALSLAPSNGDAISQELRQAKIALLEWQSKHGSRCEMVMLSIISAPELQIAIESQIERLYRQETDVAPLLQSLNVRVAILNSRGKPVKEYTLGKPVATGTINRKPWWRFW